MTRYVGAQVAGPFEVEPVDEMPTDQDVATALTTILRRTLADAPQGVQLTRIPVSVSEPIAADLVVFIAHEPKTVDLIDATLVARSEQMRRARLDEPTAKYARSGAWTLNGTLCRIEGAVITAVEDNRQDILEFARHNPHEKAPELHVRGFTLSVQADDVRLLHAFQACAPIEIGHGGESRRGYVVGYGGQVPSFDIHLQGAPFAGVLRGAL